MRSIIGYLGQDCSYIEYTQKRCKNDIEKKITSIKGEETIATKYSTFWVSPYDSHWNSLTFSHLSIANGNFHNKCFFFLCSIALFFSLFIYERFSFFCRICKNPKESDTKKKKSQIKPINREKTTHSVDAIERNCFVWHFARRFLNQLIWWTHAVWSCEILGNFSVDILVLKILWRAKKNIRFFSVEIKYSRNLHFCCWCVSSFEKRNGNDRFVYIFISWKFQLSIHSS